MGSLVLFLGAGASRPFGIPVTAEILPGVVRRLADDTLFAEPPTPPEAAAAAREELRGGLERLVPGLFRGDARAPLVTDLLSLLDELVVHGHAATPDLPVRALDRLRSLLEQAVAEVLSGNSEGEDEPNQPLLDALVRWIGAAAKDGARSLRLISTNYDIVLDKRLYALFDEDSLARELDLGMSWREARRDGRAHPRPVAPRLGLYKLHGSLDWLRCALCGHVYVDPARTIFREGAHLDEGLGRRCACGYGPLRHLIVAPSAVREIEDPGLLSIWQGALEALRTADEWVVIGYSMPPEDVAIRSLLVRAYHGRETPPRVRVVGRDDGGEVEGRYRLLFPDLVYDRGGVEGFVESLAAPA
jgi:hypothetical protein